MFSRRLSDIDHSTAANNPRSSASCSAQKNPQRIPANTPPVFPGLRPRIWPHLLRLVTNGNIGQAPSLIHRRSRHIHDLILMLIHRHSQLARIIHDGSSRNFGVARDDLKAEVFGTSNPDLQSSAFGSRPSRLSQTSAIAAEALMNNAG